MADKTSESSANYVRLTRLADEFAARFRAGERPNLQEYVDRYPELAGDIRELLPAMVEMEQAKEDHQEAAEEAAVTHQCWQAASTTAVYTKISCCPVLGWACTFTSSACTNTIPGSTCRGWSRSTASIAAAPRNPKGASVAAAGSSTAG